MQGLSPANPYDFRAPIRRRKQLAGRDDEIDQIDEYLRRSAVGRPAHFCLFGASGSGKSSLLNGVADIAVERGLLPVKVELRETTVENELAFYGAIFESAVQALITCGAIDTTHPLMRGWVRQTRAGDLEVLLDEQPLEIGLLLAAKANGRFVSVNAPALQRDVEKVVELGGPKGARGVVLCLDAAHHIDENQDIAPGLMELAGASPLLTIVTAADKAGRLQAAAPRAWAQIEVCPFPGPWAVLDAMRLPLETSDVLMRSSPATARDVHTLTSGNAYEVALVCHFMWEAVHAGEQAEFALSPAVIRSVLEELEEKGRHEASPEISAFSQLTDADYEVIARVAPYERLTVTEIALLRMMLDPFDEDRLAEIEREVREELNGLRERGVVRVERDRFELLGGADARIYLKYAAEALGYKLRFEDSFARRAMLECAYRVAEELAGPEWEDAHIVGAGRPHEVGGVHAGRWVRDLVTAVQDGNVTKLADVAPKFFDLAELLTNVHHGGFLFGLVLQIGVHEVEQVGLLINSREESQDELAARLERWGSEHAELLGRYGVRVLETHCVAFNPSYLSTVASYSELTFMTRVSTTLYEAGATKLAIEMLKQCVEGGEKLVGAEPVDPLLRSEWAEAYSRLGYMTATAGEWDDALGHLDRSQRLSLTEHWLPLFNRAYVLSRMGRVTEAAELCNDIEDQFSSHDGAMYLHADLPTPADFVPASERWNVMLLHGTWIDRFVKLQSAVWRFAARPENVEQLDRLVDDLSPAAPPEVLRLGGWSALTLRDRPDKARELLGHALDTANLDAMETIRTELAYLERPAVGD